MVAAANAAAATAVDHELPSVITCANYLKLPPYSCKAALKKRPLFVRALPPSTSREGVTAAGVVLGQSKLKQRISLKELEVSLATNALPR
jgi:hypothetical protein